MSDPYLYEGTSVLKNKLGIRQQEKKRICQKRNDSNRGERRKDKGTG